MSLEYLIFLITSIGSIQSLLIGLYFLSRSKDHPSINIVLGSLLVALGIRVGKSALYLFDPQTSEVIFNIGFAAHAASGPLLFLYLRYYPKKSWQPQALWHLLPTLLLLIVTPWIRLDNFWYLGGYAGLLFYSLAYNTAAIFVLTTNLKNTKGVERSWLLWLSVGVSVLLVAYFTNYVLGWTSYVLGPMFYAVLIYFISYFVLINHSWFTRPKNHVKYKYLNLSEEQSEHYVYKILEVFQEHKSYLSPEFNLKELAQQTSIPSYVLSHLFNDRFNTKFMDYVNLHRVDEAKRRLQDQKSAHLKISSIAYDCGFNSLSAFNQAFKKFTSATPSQFRRKE